MNKLIMTVIASYFAVSVNVLASPILEFDSAKPYLLLGVNNIELNSEYYNVQFDWQRATVFEDQEAAGEASQALVDQVFSQDFFLSLNICNLSFSNACGVSPIWLGTYAAWHGYGVSQLWGEITNPCPPGNSNPGCGYSMNKSTVVLPSDGGISIRDHVGAVGYLMACGDCGSINTVWKKQAVVSEPTGLALFGIGLLSFMITRRKRVHSKTRLDNAVL